MRRKNTLVPVAIASGVALYLVARWQASPERMIGNLEFAALVALLVVTWVVMVQWPLENGAVATVKWAREGPVKWARECPVKWAREGPVKWAREGPVKWAREGPVKWAREGPVKWHGVADSSETFAVAHAVAPAVAPGDGDGDGDVRTSAVRTDSSRAIYDEVLQPRLDRLILATAGDKKTVSKYDEDTERYVREATGKDIAAALGLEGKPSSSLKTAHEFRMISAFLCYCSQSMEKAALLERLGVGPPVYSEPEPESADTQDPNSGSDENPGE